MEEEEILMEIMTASQYEEYLGYSRLEEEKDNEEEKKEEENDLFYSFHPELRPTQREENYSRERIMDIINALRREEMAEFDSDDDTWTEEEDAADMVEPDIEMPESMRETMEQIRNKYNSH